MKRALAVFILLLLAVPAQAKSYLCRTDGSIDSYESGEALQVIKPLRQNEVEEAPLPEKAEPALAEAAQEEKGQPKKRSTFVPLTMKDIEERGAAN